MILGDGLGCTHNDICYQTLIFLFMSVRKRLRIVLSKLAMSMFPIEKEKAVYV